MNFDFYLEDLYNNLNVIEDVNLVLERLYLDIENEYLRAILSVLHKRFNNLYEFMLKKRNINNHYNANQSTLLIDCISKFDELKEVLEKEKGMHIVLNERYDNMNKFCKTFLKETGGSEIPDNLPEIKLIKYDKIFYFGEYVEIDNIYNKKYSLQRVGEGSYATVYRYKDEFYNKYFAMKKANGNLNKEELERFKREYEIMKELSSPYILEVYNYDKRKNRYFMEYADENLYSFIKKNKNLSITIRKNIVNQILRAFEYIHSKKILHRDISLTNVLIKKYENNLLVVKIADFGLVKIEDSTLTKTDTEVKGSLNDPSLRIYGFKNYNIKHEIYALTRLIFYVMNNGHYYENVSNKEKIKEFMDKGLNSDIEKRFSCVEELKNAFNKVW